MPRLKISTESTSSNRSTISPVKPVSFGVEHAVGVGLVVQAEDLVAQVDRPVDLLVPELRPGRLGLARQQPKADLGPGVPEPKTQQLAVAVDHAHQVARVGHAGADRPDHHLAEDERMMPGRADGDGRQRGLGREAAIGNRRLRRRAAARSRTIVAIRGIRLRRQREIEAGRRASVRLVESVVVFVVLVESSLVGPELAVPGRAGGAGPGGTWHSAGPKAAGSSRPHRPRRGGSPPSARWAWSRLSQPASRTARDSRGFSLACFINCRAFLSPAWACSKLPQCGARTHLRHGRSSSASRSHRYFSFRFPGT